jgi:hypothetical protein
LCTDETVSNDGVLSRCARISWLARLRNSRDLSEHYCSERWQGKEWQRRGHRVYGGGYKWKQETGEGAVVDLPLTFIFKAREGMRTVRDIALGTMMEEMYAP